MNVEKKFCTKRWRIETHTLFESLAVSINMYTMTYV